MESVGKKIKKILSWYRMHARDLPWRPALRSSSWASEGGGSPDPYAILVSEIMLQQTQVDRVIPLHKNFLSQFPTIKKLAVASPAAVLRAWKGLGYNRRALYLHRAAQQITRDGWPTSLEGMQQLPGIGPYTAGAVLAFAFGKKTSAIDVNVLRVVRRFFLGSLATSSAMEKRTRKILHEILPRDASRFQQALMDLGSRYCRAKPLCADCPMRATCPAAQKFLAGKKEIRPQKKTIRFQDSERFVRGRIMDFLREKHCSLSVLLASCKKLAITEDRVHRALHGLVREGLVVDDHRVYALPGE